MRHADSEAKKAELASTTLCILILMLAIPWTMFCAAVAAQALWGWFIASTFGLPALSLAQACGLSLAVKALTGFHADESKKREKWEIVVRAVLAPPLGMGLLLLIGWGVHQLA